MMLDVNIIQNIKFSTYSMYYFLRVLCTFPRFFWPWTTSRASPGGRRDPSPSSPPAASSWAAAGSPTGSPAARSAAAAAAAADSRAPGTTLSAAWRRWGGGLGAANYQQGFLIVNHVADWRGGDIYLTEKPHLITGSWKKANFEIN